MQLTLKEARGLKGWSLEQLSARCGINKSTLSRLERGRNHPYHDTVCRLEAAFGFKHGVLVFPSRNGGDE